MGEESPQTGWARSPLDAAPNLPSFISVLIVAVVVGFSLDACSAPSSEPTAEEAPSRTASHAEAHAAAEKAAGLSPGTLGFIPDVHSVFLRCSSRMSVLTPPVEQRRCFGWGAAVSTYTSMRWDSLAEDYRNVGRIASQRMGDLGWLSEGEPVFQPIGVGR